MSQRPHPNGLQHSRTGALQESNQRNQNLANSAQAIIDKPAYKEIISESSSVSEYDPELSNKVAQITQNQGKKFRKTRTSVDGSITFFVDEQDHVFSVPTKQLA